MLPFHRQYVKLDKCILDVADSVSPPAPPCRGGNWPGAYGRNSGLQLFLIPVVLAESANLIEMAQRDRLNELLGGEKEESEVQVHVKRCEELLTKAAKVSRLVERKR